MNIHREGIVTIFFVSLLLMIAILSIVYFSVVLLLKIVFIIPFLALFLLILWFFRVPNRKVIRDDSLIYAPADGKIVVIENTIETEYFKDERIQVSIFMSPLNVHQNIYPLSGTVVYTKYHKGDYLVAWHPKSSTQNERSTVVIKHKNGIEILVRQIAGAVARRICTYVKEGDDVVQGDEFGFIKFGSRVDLFLPPGIKIECNLNQTAYNKKTIIARFI